MYKTVGLIEIDGFRDVFGDDGIVLPWFGNAIHLHGEYDGNIVALQIAGQQDGSGGSPAVAEENDSDSRFFFRRKHTIMVRIQEPDYCLVRVLSAAIFKYLHISALGSGSLELARDDDRAMVGILMADKSADESDHNIGGSLSGGRPDGRIRGAQNRQGGGKGC